MRRSPAPAEATAAAAPSPASDRRGGALGIALALSVFVAVAALFQLLTPVPWDADTAYHFAVGQLLAEHGILKDFPWTPFSWLATNYADKELLFHLLLAPLGGLGWIWGSKLLGVVLGAAVLAVIWAILKAEQVPRPVVWALVPLAASGAFVVRFAVVRPHLLSLALALALLWAALRRRPLLVLALSFLYPWCYIAWHLPLVLVAIAEASALLSGRRPGWRALAAAVAGVGAGVLLHPNAANLVRLWWLVNAQILVRGAWGGATGFELGGEFRPFGAADAARYLLPAAGMAVAALAVAWRGRARDHLPLGFALAAAAWGAMTIGSQRFVEYFVPFAAAALALALRDRPVRVAAGVLAGAFAWTAAAGAAPVVALGTRGDEIPPPFQELLRATVPAGAQVFTCDWGLTGELMVALPERRFVVALDPTLFWAKDPDLYALWYRLPREGPADARALIRDRFGARWVICFNRPVSEPLLRRLAADPGARVVFANPLWAVFDLGP